MTYFVAALTNDRAQLLEKWMRTTDARTAETVAAIWKAEGLIVNTIIEE